MQIRHLSTAVLATVATAMIVVGCAAPPRVDPTPTLTAAPIVFATAAPTPTLIRVSPDAASAKPTLASQAVRTATATRAATAVAAARDAQSTSVRVANTGGQGVTLRQEPG